MQPASAAKQPIIEASVGSLAADWITRMMPKPADSRPVSTQPFGLPAQLDAWAHHVPIVFGGAKFALRGTDVRSCRAEKFSKIDIPSASADIGELSGKWLSHLLLRNSVPIKQIACTLAQSSRPNKEWLCRPCADCSSAPNGDADRQKDDQPGKGCICQDCQSVVFGVRLNRFCNARFFNLELGTLCVVPRLLRLGTIAF